MQYEEKAHFNMLEQQIRPTDVTDARLLAALKQIRRTDFVDDDFKGLAYADTCLPIGYGQMMLPPILQSNMLQALAIKADETVFEIGTGTGYFTALLAVLAKHVTTVDIIPELSAIARQQLAVAGLDNVTYCVGDASQDWALDDRVDVIVSTAALVDVPEAYLMRLNVGGRLMAVVGEDQVMEVRLIERTGEREWQTHDIMETYIPAMVNAEPKAAFEF